MKQGGGLINRTTSPPLSSCARAPRLLWLPAPFAVASCQAACKQCKHNKEQGHANIANRFLRSSASRVKRNISLRRCSNDSTSSGITSIGAAGCLPLEPRLSQLLSTAAGGAAKSPCTPSEIMLLSLAVDLRRARDFCIDSLTNGCSPPSAATSSSLRCLRTPSKFLNLSASDSLAFDCLRASVMALLKESYAEINLQYKHKKKHLFCSACRLSAAKFVKIQNYGFIATMLPAFLAAAASSSCRRFSC
jgi:hypothetical protein